MLWFISFAFLLIAGTAAAVNLWARIRTLDAQKHSCSPFVDTDRYRPMLRLLVDNDADLMIDPALRRKLRARRCGLFREYLGHLADDYGKLLAGVRLIMTESGDDRPDLARALARNRVMFAVGLCRVEFRLCFYSLGIGKADVLTREVQGLVNALDMLRGQFNLVESAVWGG